MGPDQEHFAVLHRGVRVAQVDPAGPEGLDLGAGQGDAGLQRLLDEVVVVGLLVLCDELDAGGFHSAASIADRRRLPRLWARRTRPYRLPAPPAAAPDPAAAAA